jgi:hypothetical protein
VVRSCKNTTWNTDVLFRNLDLRSNATASAVTYIEVEHLHKDVLWHILEDFPHEQWVFRKSVAWAALWQTILMKAVDTTKPTGGDSWLVKTKAAGSESWGGRLECAIVQSGV